MAAQLTPGAVAEVWDHAEGNNRALQPVLQVLDWRMVPNTKNPSTSDRYRMVLCDGVHTMQSMLATGLNWLLRDGAVKNGSIVQLQEFTCSTVHNRRIVIVIKLDVLQSECDIIGDPKPYDVRIQPNEQGTNFPPNAAQAKTGTYSSGPGMRGSSAAPSSVQDTNNVLYGSSAAPRGVQDVNNLPYGSSASPRPVQDSNNVPYSGSYGGYRSMIPPVGRAVESVPNVASGVSYGTTSAHNNNTMNVGMVQSNMQQPSLNSHQNQRFAAPSMASGSGAPGNTYGQPAQPFYQQPPPGHMNRAPVSKNDAIRIVPVAQLNPYQERWTIMARVTSKTDLRHYTNDKGPGKRFSFDLLDGQGGEIRTTCFNAQVDQFFDLIEVDKVYLISKGKVKKADKKWNSLNHEYEITLDFKTSIEVCVDDDNNIPRQQYNFRQISEIESIDEGAMVDLIGIVTSVGPSATILKKDGSEAQKRTLQLKDMSGRSVEITLWGKFCDAEGQQLQWQNDSGSNPVLALKGARVTQFNGRSVSTIGSTQLKVDPDLPEAESLRRWYATEGKTAACVSLSSMVSMGRSDVRKAVAQIKDENLGRSDKPDFITVKGAISHIVTDNFCYPACTGLINGRQCNKKIINNGDGTWQCDRCNQSSQNCEYRYMLRCQIQDHTGVTYATAFHEAAIEIVGHSAHELYNTKEEDPERFAEILQGVRWQQFLFKLRVTVEIFNDEQNVKCSIMKAEKLDPAKESSYLLGVINGLLQDDSRSPSEVQGAMVYNASLSNAGAGRSVPTSNRAYTGPRYGESSGNVQTCMSCGSTGHNAQNCPAGMYRQQPAASMASSYGSRPLLAPAPQQQQYRSSGAFSGGYGQQGPYLGATKY